MGRCPLIPEYTPDAPKTTRYNVPVLAKQAFVSQKHW